LGINAIQSLAEREGQHGIFFSLEMDQDSLAMRLLTSHGCDGWKANSLLYRSSHTDEVYGLLEGALEGLRGLPLRVVDTPQLCANDILHLGRRAKIDGGLDFIIVDYLQLMDANERHGEIYERVRAISRELKQAAKTLKVAVIAISQLSRQVENRTPPRPMMSDLRESGQLEQDADKILLLYRPGYYGDAECRAAHFPEGPEYANLLELGILKQRNGRSSGRTVLQHAGNYAIRTPTREQSAMFRHRQHADTPIEDVEVEDSESAHHSLGYSL
jgi:replicative DNA helicase